MDREEMNAFFTDPSSSFSFIFPISFRTYLSSVHAPSPLPKFTASPGETNAIPTAINHPCAFIVAVLYSLQHFGQQVMHRDGVGFRPGRWSTIKVFIIKNSRPIFLFPFQNHL
ncbi:hypothetical protein I3843_16G060000 [Carya illinoinensis]|nr:hypothetical protein I3843_16G060000 [Carya illinoinensis]